MANIYSRRTNFIICFGALLEYYDFIIFGLAVHYLAKIFFANNESGLFFSYLIFAVGYFFRPIGGIILSGISDLKGRKKIFSTILLSTGLSTIMIGLLPTNSKLNIISIIMLMIFRIIQSINFGAEIPNASTIIYETTIRKSLAIRISYIILYATLGSILASLTITSLSNFLNENEMLKYGWRIPFIIGGAAALLNYTYRKNLLETTEFLKYNADNPRRNFYFILSVIYKYRFHIGFGICLNLLGALFVINNIFFPSYIGKFSHFPIQSIYTATTIGLIWCFFMIYIAGNIIRYITLKNWILIFIIFIITILFLVTKLGILEEIVTVYFFIFAYQTFNAFTVVFGLYVVSQIFPVEIRSSGIALTYNVAYALASLFIAGAFKLIEMYNNPLLIYFCLMGAVIILGAISWKYINNFVPGN